MLTANTWAQTSPDIKSIAFFLQDGVEILDFAGPMEVFTSAGFNVFTVAETKDPIKAMRVLTVVPDYSIDDAPKADMVAFFGGGGATHKSQQDNLKAWTKKQVENTDIQFSVCTGAFFLGEVGLLDGKTATTFHSAIPHLQERFPKATVRDDVRFVDNGLVITTAGISAGIDGALHLVSKIHGKDFAQSVADNMEYFGWEPEKGLVFDNPFIQNIQEKGIEAALKAADEKNIVFKGELLNLGNSLWAKKQQEKALAVFDYMLEKYPLSAIDCSTIRKVFAASGRETPPSEAEFFAMIENDNMQKARSILEQTKINTPNWQIFREWRINVLGYQYLGKQDWDNAIGVFQLNVEAYPNSFNTYDSLGEAYMLAGKKDLAIKNYKKSLALNPNNENGVKMLKKLNEKEGMGKKSK
ncbi:MAG: hypothetical protein DHS20C18_27500 [Saprospiraceae bacterium]|nr:MAG: hypothetical protein DHS20C18_27500 [Saprospiraceae bacterium]